MRDHLTVRGHALEVCSWGHGEPPIVLLHEGLGSVARWRDFPVALAQATERRVFAYSRAGHGTSDPPARPRTGRFMHEEAIEWLPQLLDRADIERAVLFGHSDGASIALIFAATHPSRVDALVLEAPHVFVEPLSIESIDKIRARYETTDLGARLAKYHRHVDAAFRGWCDVWLHPTFREWTLEEYLAGIVSPVLLIQGEQDQYGTLRQLEAITRGVSGPVDTVILPACRHSPHLQQRQWTLAAVTAFLARATGSRSTAGRQAIPAQMPAPDMPAE